MGLGDPDRLDALARRLDALATSTDEAGAHLVTTVNALPWHSAAAEAFRGRAAERRDQVRGDAESLRHAAVQVRALAGDVRDELAVLRRTGATLAGWLHQAGEFLGVVDRKPGG